MKYKGYTMEVNYSEKDNCLRGKIKGLEAFISFEGNSLRKLKREFKKAVDFYLDACKIHGWKIETPLESEEK